MFGATRIGSLAGRIFLNVFFFQTTSTRISIIHIQLHKARDKVIHNILWSFMILISLVPRAFGGGGKGLGTRLDFDINL